MNLMCHSVAPAPQSVLRGAISQRTSIMNNKSAEVVLSEFKAAQGQITEAYKQGDLTFEQASCQLWAQAKTYMQSTNPQAAAVAPVARVHAMGEPWLCLA